MLDERGSTQHRIGTPVPVIASRGTEGCHAELPPSRSRAPGLLSMSQDVLQKGFEEGVSESE